MEIPTRDNEIQRTLAKYLEEEKVLNDDLQECKTRQLKRESFVNFERTRNPRRQSYMKNEEAKERNQQLLMDLEMSRARWRTLTSFTPTDQELTERIIIYRKYLLNS